MRRSILASAAGLPTLACVLACSSTATRAPVAARINSESRASEVTARSDTDEEVGGSSRCAVILRIEIAPWSETDRHIIAIAENTTTDVLELGSARPCRDRLLSFALEGTSYDLHGDCNRGACVEPQAEDPVALAPGERRPIYGLVVSLHDDTSCRPRLAAKRYTVTAAPPRPSVGETCVVGATLEVPELAEAPPPAPTRPHAPDDAPESPHGPTPKQRSKVEPMYACEADNECTLSCPSVKGCCQSACGCRHALNRAFTSQHEADHARTCRKEARCPAEGCAYRPARGARCRMGRCVATDGL